MGYLQTIYNNIRYIVFIQTKDHPNIIPENDVSASSLETLLKTIAHHRGGYFRSIRIYRDDITALRIYERNFINYKTNVLSKSEYWSNIYKKYHFIQGFLDFILYFFVFIPEINKFGKTVTNSKSKYLIDKTNIALTILYGKRREYPKNKDGKEIIGHIDYHNGNLVINEQIFTLDETIKASYFLQLLARYFEKEETCSIELCDYIDLYDKSYNKDEKEYNYLKLSKDNVKNGYIKTINDNILKKYDKEILEIDRNFIGIIQDSKKN